MDHRVRGALLVAAMSALAACGGSTSEQPAATSSTGPVPAGALQAKLLTEADVGSSWQLGHAVNDADFSDAMQLPCGDAAINPTITARLTPTAGVQFEPVDHASTHLMELARTGEPGRLAADLDIFHEAIDACAGRPPAGEDAEGGTVDVTDLAVPELGDQRFAVALTGSAPSGDGVTWFVRMATVRVGGFAIDVRLTEVLDAPSENPRMSDEAFVALVEQPPPGSSADGALRVAIAARWAPSGRRGARTHCAATLRPHPWAGGPEANGPETQARCWRDPAALR